MLGLLRYDSRLKPYEKDIQLRMKNYKERRSALLKDAKDLSELSNGYLYFGIHREPDGSTVYREWAPGAEALHLYGDFNGWDPVSHPMKAVRPGIFEITLSGKEALRNGQKYKVLVTHRGETEEHIPAYASYVTQDPVTYIWSSEVHFEDGPFPWKNDGVRFALPPVVYECHIGMAQEKPAVGTYREFTEKILPRIREDGYNTIQLMAVMEHPYYASFGYQVTNFFAASSRYGTPEELKELIDTAHGMGIRVLLDLVHSHAAGNVKEGLNHFDGTDTQYFHGGERGIHPAWGTRLFDYGRTEVLHFLLSNLKFWLTEYHFDGFRFDGVTSMLYLNHGLGEIFDSYEKYFTSNTDPDAVVYLQLANELIHEIRPDALTLAEDMSGMPGMCVPVPEGGLGFDYRLAMGVPDLWTRLLSEKRDEDWDLWQIWYELTTRRPHEKNIGYAESHDQALVGDKTIMFRLCDSEMYRNMSIFSPASLVIDRGMALHKMIRLLTFSLAGEGYLNFMGNEFGHPEWVDFPRDGNGWSHEFCRRQWHLCDDRDLKYHYLRDFDEAMLKLGKGGTLYAGKAHILSVNEEDRVMIYERGGLVFALNLDPVRSYTGYFVPVFTKGSYQTILSTDDRSFGGFGRIDTDVLYEAEQISDERTGFLVYLPSRTGMVFCRK